MMNLISRLKTNEATVINKSCGLLHVDWMMQQGMKQWGFLVADNMRANGVARMPNELTGSIMSSHRV